MTKLSDTILIIEDDADLIELISDKITESGFKSISFSRAEHAIKWLADNTPLLIILDYNLPDYNGFEFISVLKSRKIDVPPFIVATGQGDERIAVQMMKQGARDYIIKDTHFLDLIVIIIQNTIKDIENEHILEHTKQELIELHQYKNQIIECANEGIVVYDKDLNYVLWNRFMEDLTGVKAIDVVGKSIKDVFPFLLENQSYENIQKTLSGEFTEEEFYFEIANTGKQGWVNNYNSVLLNTNNETIGVISAVHNITDRKIAEYHLLESKSALRKLVVSSSDLIESALNITDFGIITDTICEISGASYAALNILEDNGIELKTVGFSGVSEANSEACAILGFDLIDKKWKYDPKRDELLQENRITKYSNIHLLTEGVLKPNVSAEIEKTFELGEVYVVMITKNNKRKGDFTLFFKNGDSFHNTELVELYAYQIGLYIERQNAERDLKESEKKYRILFEENPQPMFIYEMKSLKILEVNNEAKKHYGYSQEELLTMKISNLYVDNNFPEVLKHINVNIKGHKVDGVSEHIKKNGEIIYVETNAMLTPNYGNQIIQLIISDITLRKLAEDNLRRSFSLLHATLESTDDGILVIDRKGNTIIYNQKFVTMWNIPLDILKVKTNTKLLQFITDQVVNHQLFIQKVQHIYNNFQLSSTDFIELKDGRSFESISLPQILDTQIVGRIFSFRDITERLKAEREIYQRIEEMTRFHNLTVDRELTMIQLKDEINELYKQLGKEKKYKIVN